MKHDWTSTVGSRDALRFGSKGFAVSELQRRLQNAGLYRGTIDGIYGSRTANAVKIFQSRFKLTMDGIAGPRTWAMLTGNLAAEIPLSRPLLTMASARPMTGAIRRVKVWWNTFIPMAMIDGPPGSQCFAGDNRGPSNAIHAPHRTHQEIEVDVATLAMTINWKHVGETHEVDCVTGAVVARDTAPTSQLDNGPVSRDGSNILIGFSTAASNPLVTFAPAIDSAVTFQIDPVARTCSLSGHHDGFPAYEAYVTADGGAGVLVYNHDPRIKGQNVSALFPPAEIKVAVTGVGF
jgi:hypothetical protein